MITYFFNRTKESIRHRSRHTYRTVINIADQYRPFRTEQGTTATSIIGNAISKSGTCLLNGLLKSAGGWIDAQVHIGTLNWIDKTDDTDVTHWSRGTGPCDACATAF